MSCPSRCYGYCDIWRLLVRQAVVVGGEDGRSLSQIQVYSGATHVQVGQPKAAFRVAYHHAERGH